MATPENLAKFRSLLSTFANLIREGEGTTEPISGAEMRQRLSELDVYRFYISPFQGVNYIYGEINVDGVEDPSVPANAKEHFRKLISNFTVKVKKSTDRPLYIDEVIQKSTLVCGIHKDSHNKFGVRVPAAAPLVGALYGSNITSINFEEGITEIGGCSLTEVNKIHLPSTLQTIRQVAFIGCRFTSVTIPDNVVIGKEAFRDTWLQNIEFGDNVSISARAFQNISRKTYLVLPSSIKAIEEGAFTIPIFSTYDEKPEAWASNLSDYGIIYGFENVLTVDDYAYVIHHQNNTQAATLMSFDTAINECTIPETINNIPVDGMLPHFTQGHTFLHTVNILAHCTTIPNSAFYQCLNLKNINIPDSVTSIGKHAFDYCPSLKTISLPSVQLIDDFAFYKCDKLTSIDFPSVQTIGKQAFEACKFPNLVCPNTLTMIKERAFYNGTKSVFIPSSVTSIERNAFFSNTTRIFCDFPKKPTTWDTYWCYNPYDQNVWWNVEKTIEINGVYYVKRSDLDDVTVYGCDELQTSYTITDSIDDRLVTAIESTAFANCTNLTEIILPNTISHIHVNAFYECSNLTHIEMPSCQMIAQEAFRNCYNLHHIQLPSNLVRLSDDVFMGCNSLESIIIPDSVQYMGSGIFSGCSDLTTVTLSTSCTFIPDYAFYECNSLSSVTIPSGVTKINYQAFSGCWALKSIILPDSIVEIESDAFIGSGLESVQLPSSIRSLGDGAFFNCSSLASIEIPNSIETIEADSCATGNSNLEIHFLGTMDECSQYDWFEAVNGELSYIHCLDGDYEIGGGGGSGSGSGSGSGY